MYVITFYSFKGGVGRTMALVNVAAELARRGRKVLLADFDLEAPGLETYPALKPGDEGAARRIRRDLSAPNQARSSLPGIVEFVTEYRRTGHVPSVLDFIYKAAPVGDKEGGIWVMPAGRRDPAYRHALAGLDWRNLYKNEEGFLLIEDMKKAWAEELKPDYVLIDSRTGETEVLGICTRQLPDALVLMFAPNEQNLAGLETVCQEVRRENERRNQAIRLYFVAANVPDLDDENDVLERQMQAFRAHLGFKELTAEIRRYENLDLLEQNIVVLDRPRSKLAGAYCLLTNALIKDNRADREGAVLFLKEYFQKHLPRIQQDSRSFLNRRLGLEEEDHFHLNDLEINPSFEDPLNDIAGHFLDDAEVLGLIAECRILEGDFEKAVRVFDRVLQLQSDRTDLLFRRGLCKKNLGRVVEGAEDLFHFLLQARKSGTGWMAALRHLHALAPAKAGEAVDALRAQGFLGAGRLRQARESKRLGDADAAIRAHIRVANLLSNTEEGVAWSASLLRELIGEMKTTEKRRALQRMLFCASLLQARCWQELIQFLEPLPQAPREQVVQLARSLETMGPRELFFLALAYWGARGEMPESLCQFALQNDDGEVWELGEQEEKSWLLWRVGRQADAITLLEEVQNHNRKQVGEIFSLWRHRWVTVEQYLDDCQWTRRMFQGEPLRPAFLGPPQP